MATAEQTVQVALELGRQGRLRDAVLMLRRVLQRQPGNWIVGAALGQCLMQAGELEQSLFQFRRCLAAAPRGPASHNNVGLILELMNRGEEAVAAFRESIRLDPAYAPGWLGLSMALLRRRDFQGAVGALKEVLKLSPDMPQAYHNLGLALMDAGQVEEGFAPMREGLARAPWHAPMRSTFLMGLNYRSVLSPEDTRKEHEEFGRAHTPTPGSFPARTDPDPGRTLRVGVLSSDFREQSVMYFFEPILEHRDKSGVEYVGFSTVAAADATTARLRRHTVGWVDATMPDDLIVDRLIREQKIDILLDLSGHSGANRLTTIKDQPAPVIITAIGYPNTTGMPAVAYRIVDSLTDPPGAEAFATERLLRLDPCFLCYRPPESPGVAPPPSATGAPVTFGSFNALPKLSPETVRTWAALLERTAGSRLLIKATALEGAWAREKLLELFTAAGVDQSRIELLRPTQGTQEHLSLYGRIDIALDPFPYNGTTTTCEAMWMGVPVVALAGDRHAGRVGVSLLSAVGLSELVAPTPERYVEIAAGLAGDPARLAELRRGLRTRMAASVLCDGPGYARRFERVLRAVWQGWCSGQRKP